MYKRIEDIYPILAAEGNQILSKQGDLTIAFQLQLPELFTLSEQAHENLHHAWVRAMRLLPAGTVVHKQDHFIEAAHGGTFAEDQSFLSCGSEKFFHERNYLEHDCYLFLTCKAKRVVHSAASSLVRGRFVAKENFAENRSSSFEDAVSQFVRVLTDTGLITADVISADGIRSLIEFYFTLNDKRRIGDIQLKERMMIGEQYVDHYTLDYPSICGPRIHADRYSTDNNKIPTSFASAIGPLLGCSHLYNQFVLIQEPREVMRELESKKKRLQSLSNYARTNAVAAEEVHQYLQEAVSEQRQPVRTHFNLCVWNDDIKRLKAVRNMVSAAAASMDATVKTETVGAPQLWWAGIPGNAGELPFNETLQSFSGVAACFFNQETNYQSSISPIGLRLGDRITGRPLHVDLSDEPMQRGIITNRNKFILGPSGSGKSFFTNHMMRSYYEQGSHAVLVDVGHSYKGLCELVKGYYFSYSASSPIAFNPFYSEGEIDTEKKESIKTLLLALWKKDSEEFKRSEYVALSDAIQSYYATEVSFRCFNSFYEFLRGTFAERVRADQVRERHFDLDNFLYVLRPYYRGGEYDFLLNAEKNLDLLSQRFIVFELDQVKDHPILFPVVTIIIMEVFISKMRKLQGVRKIILIEEAWKAIAKEGMAEYIKYLFKTVRKFYGEAIVVTQDIEDIISSPIVKQTIINNADCKILLDQSKYQNKFEQVQELLGLSDHEKALVLSLNRANDPLLRYKEVFISLGGQLSKVYRTEVSPEEYYAYTTEEKEKMKVSAAAKREGSIEKGIRSVISNE